MRGIAVLVLVSYAIAHAAASESPSLGQLLFINVDGHGAHEQAIHPDYYKLVRELDPGGVLPHFNGRDVITIRAAVQNLKRAARTPLLVGMDYTELDPPLGGIGTGVGMGFGSGLIGAHGSRLGPECMRELFVLQAYIQAALGFNLVLGPTVDRSPRFGYLDNEPSRIVPLARQLLEQCQRFNLLPVIKHFPYTPSAFSLHREGRDEPLDSVSVQSKVGIFEALYPQTSLLMTTHIFNSHIDPMLPVTFSPTWVAFLRSQGYRGPLITDALLMIEDYGYLAQRPELLQLPGVPEVRNRFSVFAARAILAGHDLVILEGDASSTREVVRDLNFLLHHRSSLGRSFSLRVAEAQRAVSKLKAQHGTILGDKPEQPLAQLQAAIALLTQVQASPDSRCRHTKAFEVFNKHL